MGRRYSSDNEGFGYVCEEEQGHSTGARVGAGMRCFPRGVVWVGWPGIRTPRGLAGEGGREGGSVITVFFPFTSPVKFVPHEFR